jgi:DNA-binding NtrC family response regulator
MRRMTAQNEKRSAATLAVRSRPVEKRPTRALPSRVAGPVRALRLLRGDSATTLRLDERERYVIGRHDAADLIFDTPEVSRLHGVLRCAEGHWVFEDYASQNGTTLVRVDDIRPLKPHDPCTLHAFDVIELGGEQARIEALPDEEVAEEDDNNTAVDVSKASRAFTERVKLAARTRVPVFLLGPSGVGKTFTARQIHDESRLPGPFVPINCARLPQEPSALHSELLGHVRGAYTGAESARTGKLVQADGGTLFLDEVESLPSLAQGFLLDVLEGSGDLAPLGAQGPRLKPVAFRLIAASKQPLANTGLRSDLCERLAEGHLWRVPTLDERRDDIPGLVRRFAAEQEKMLNARVVVTPAAIRFCADAKWPGQIRQLRAAVVVLAQLGLAKQPDDQRGAITLRDTDFAGHLAERDDVFGVVETVRTKADARSLTPQQIRQAIAAAGGSKARAAEALGISRNTLAKKAKEIGL